MKTVTLFTLTTIGLSGCAMPEAPQGQAKEGLSVAASHVYTITNSGAPSAACNDPNSGAWCRCGTDYTDNASRCNTAGEVAMIHIPALGCEVASATLSYQASAWNGDGNVTIRRILRSVTAPEMGNAGYCPGTNGKPINVASWMRSGPEPWALPGAAANDSDRSTAAAQHFKLNQDGSRTNLGGVVASGGQRTERFDATSILGGCSAGCVIAQYNSGAHVNIIVGTATIESYTCAGPSAVCGDGTVDGAESCDDGGVLAGDGCSATCSVEAGWSCSGAPSTCATTCGDGVKAGAEQCDDGNTASNDGCSSACVAETCLWQ